MKSESKDPPGHSDIRIFVFPPQGADLFSDGVDSFQAVPHACVDIEDGRENTGNVARALFRSRDHFSVEETIEERARKAKGAYGGSYTGVPDNVRREPERKQQHVRISACVYRP